MVFKNHGEAAGASLEHPHSQLIATPIVPHHGRGGAGGRAPALPDQEALHLVRHHPAGAAGRAARSILESGRASWRSRPSRRAFRSRPGSCPTRAPVELRGHAAGATSRRWPRRLGEVLRPDGAVSWATRRTTSCSTRAPLRGPGPRPLPLAPRDHPQADAGWPASSGAPGSSSTRPPRRRPRSTSGGSPGAARKLTPRQGVCYTPSRFCDRMFCGNSSVVEHNLAKVGVAGSNPVSRSSIAGSIGSAGRRSQVAKAEVCKTSIQRFESARRLQYRRAVAAVGRAGVAELGDAADLKSAGP